MKFARMIMEAEAPNLVGYDTMTYNLSESSVRDRTLAELNIDLSGLELPYGHHFGEPRLRQLIAEQSADNITADDVMVTAGAAGALFLIAASLLEPREQVVVAFPNYATNFETPLAIGCDVVFHNQTFDNGFAIDLDTLASQIGPQTKLVSLTVPHNPSGTVIPEEQLRAIIELVESKGVYLLFDETYRDMTYGQALPLAASLSKNVISVGSMSKTWGVPGIRIGWLISRDAALINKLIAGKEQIAITGSVVDEEIAIRILDQRDQLLPTIRAEIADQFALMRDWVGADPNIDWVEPQAGVAALIRVREADDERMTRIYHTLRNERGVYVAPGYWFKLSLDQMRIGFGWAHRRETEKALAIISDVISTTR